MKKIVALFGRPNVGKSTLFNRLTRTRDAIVDNKPGITRDRKTGYVNYDEASFILVDTGGFISDDADVFAGDIKAQLIRAMEDCDIITIVFDGKFGLSSYDRDLLEMLRNIDKPKFFIVNKIDGPEKEGEIFDFYQLGIDNIYPVSGEHGYGIDSFMQDLLKEIPIEESLEAEEPSIIKVAIVGKPNAGKSSLVNKLTGEERMVVSDIPGTTRDSVDTVITYEDNEFLLIDTAGIRRKSRVNDKIEKFSVIKALKSLERCDIALVLIDASEGITEQDVKIAGYAEERGCGAIFVLNKWDKVEKNNKSHKQFEEMIRYEAGFLPYAPIITISAKTGQRVGKIFSLINKVYKEYKTRISTSKVNSIIESAVLRTTPPMHKGKRLKFYYSSQVAVAPPTFVSFVNYPDAVHFSYKRFLLNKLREHTGLKNTPIVLNLRQRRGREGYIDQFPKKQNKKSKKHSIRLKNKKR